MSGLTRCHAQPGQGDGEAAGCRAVAGAAHGYDLAIDDGSGAGLKTVQCKTGRFRNGCIVWSSCSSHSLTHVKTGYRGQVDYFGVWCPDFDDVYLVPVGEVGERESWLRADPAKNGRKEENIRWAKDYKVYRLEAER